MRVLVVQESNWLEKGPHQSHHLMERLSLRGHQIKVIDFDILWRRKANGRILEKRKVFEEAHKAVDNSSVTVIRPQIVKLPLMDYLSLSITHGKEIRKQIAEFKPDVIVGFGLLNAFISVRMARKHGIPFVYYIIDELHQLVPQKFLRPLACALERQNFRLSGTVLTINEGLRDYALSMGASLDGTRVIRAGVDIARYSQSEEIRRSIRKKHGFEDEDIVLFFMGWLYEFSGLVEVVRELSKAEWRKTKLKLMIIGDGPIWNRLQRLEQRLNISDKLALVEWVPYRDVPGYIVASDICILPAQENEIMRRIVPIKIYEYMAGGRPVVSTRLSGIVKEFGEGNGVLYVDCPEDVIGKAYDLSLDSGIQSHQQAARRFVEDNDWETTTDTFENLLNEVRQ